MKINYERIKYSPFGKSIVNSLRFRLILILCTAPLGLVISLIMGVGAWWMGLIFALFSVGIPVYFAVSAIGDTLFEARLLSSMTDEEHNGLIEEYKKFEERNIIRYGHLTSYGLILDNRILPWENIKKIEIKPGEYRRVYSNRGSYMRYFPAKIVVTSLFDKKPIASTYSVPNEEYDLSEEIEHFLDSIPKYTEHRFLINNNYHFAKYG